MIIVLNFIAFFLFCLVIVQTLQYIEMLEIRKYEYKQAEINRVERKDIIEELRGLNVRNRETIY